MKPFAEAFLKTLRSECLDHLRFSATATSCTCCRVFRSITMITGRTTIGIVVHNPMIEPMRYHWRDAA